MNTINDIYNLCKINWTGFYAEFDDCQNDSPISFETMPEEYLKFAKNNIQNDCKQSSIDAIGNAKRAIDAQIDLLISTFGFDYKLFDNYSTYPNTKAFINQNYKGEICDGIVPRIQLLHILGLAPTLLISEIRHLRNKMEHEYIAPSRNYVKKAIEIAELFINSSNRKLSYAPTAVSMSNKEKEKTEKYTYHSVGFPYINIVFRSYISTEEVRIEYVENDNSRNEIKLKVDDPQYIECINLLFKEDVSLCPQIFGYDLDLKYIKNLYD